MRFLFYLLAVICLYGCEWNRPYQPSDKEKITNEIMKKAATKIYKELGLIPCGTGGQMMDQIKMLGLSFDYREPVDIEIGRRLLVAAVQEFATEINADVRIRPYLDKFPFEPKNIEIAIFLQDRNGKDFGQGILCIISAKNGFLEYDIHNPNERLKTIYRETYEEALRILSDIEQSSERHIPNA